MGGGASVEYKFDDPDGPGGAAPTIQDIVLAPSTTYDAELILLNKKKSSIHYYEKLDPIEIVRIKNKVSRAKVYRSLLVTSYLISIIYSNVLR